MIQPVKPGLFSQIKSWIDLSPIRSEIYKWLVSWLIFVSIIVLIGVMVWFIDSHPIVVLVGGIAWFVVVAVYLIKSLTFD